MPANIQVQPNYPQQKISLSPETKSALWSGVMASTLGATWLADAKIGADTLLTLPCDKFEKATKGISKLSADTPARQALEYIKQFRESLKTAHVEQVQKIFGDKAETTILDALKTVNPKLTSELRGMAYFRQLTKNMEAMDLVSRMPEELAEAFEKGINQNTFKKLDELIPNSAKSTLGQYREAFKQQFPIGTKLTEESLIDFISQKITPLYNQRNQLNVIRRLANEAGENGKITKDTATKALKRFNMDALVEQTNQCFNAMKSKLPKARLKGALKWFGIGIGISILSNMIFGLFTRKKK